MAVQIASEKAVLTVEDAGAHADSQIDHHRNLLFGHLTLGWNGQDWVQDALTCTANVPLTGPQDEVNRLELGFVQVARANSFQAFYAGRIASEGGIGLNYFISPALMSNILLDGKRGVRDPWFSTPVFATARGDRRNADFGDHPGMVVRLSLENKVRSNVRNFLFHAFMDRDFWTILTAIEGGGPPKYIAHFQWRLRYEFKVQWLNGIPKVRENSSFIRIVKRQTMGRPPERELDATLNTPAGQRANKIGERAELMTVTGNVPNRTDYPTRFMTVPEDFWG
jgi:hypothetical protein